MAGGFTPPVIGGKPAPGIPAKTEPAASAATQYVVGGTTAPLVCDVPQGANAQLDTPPADFPDRTPRESQQLGHGTGAGGVVAH